MSLLGSASSPSAKLADGRLVLNLPDAETPAVWVMELNDAHTSVLRLENDAKGFYVLKKHGGARGAAAETIAVYRDRDRAAYALQCTARAFEKARNTRPLVGPNAQPVIIRPASKVARVLTWVLVGWFVLYLFSLDGAVLRMMLSPFVASPQQQQQLTQEQIQQLQQMQQMQQQAQDAAQQPAVPPTAGGVPLSADDFLRAQRNTTR